MTSEPRALGSWVGAQHRCVFGFNIIKRVVGSTQFQALALVFLRSNTTNSSKMITNSYQFHCNSYKIPTNSYYLLGKSPADATALRLRFILIFVDFPAFPRIFSLADQPVKKVGKRGAGHDFPASCAGVLGRHW